MASCPFRYDGWFGRSVALFATGHASHLVKMRRVLTIRNAHLQITPTDYVHLNMKDKFIEVRALVTDPQTGDVVMEKRSVVMDGVDSSRLCCTLACITECECPDTALKRNAETHVILCRSQAARHGSPSGVSQQRGSARDSSPR
jgi:hypothetical protein